MNEILSACGGWVFVNVLEFHKRFRIINFKPLNCDVCMSGWIYLALSFNTVYWHYIPLHMSLAMVATIFLNKLLK